MVLFLQRRKKIKNKLKNLQDKNPEKFYMEYVTPLDVDLTSLEHYPSIEISKMIYNNSSKFILCIDGYLELRRRLMKTVFTWVGTNCTELEKVVQQLSISDVDCPELFSSTEDEISYSQILGDLEQRYSEVKEPLLYLRSFVRCASCD